jgi:hypothetical protein
MTQAIYVLTEHLSMVYMTDKGGLELSHYVCDLGHEFQPGELKRVGLTDRPMCPTCECIKVLIDAGRRPAQPYEFWCRDEFADITLDVYWQVVAGFAK